MAYHAPEDVAAVLKIQSSTLRKYALLLENNGYTFKKNAHGHRWFSDTDMSALRKFITFKDSGGMTLDESAAAVFLWSKGGDIAPQDTQGEAIQDVVKRDDLFTAESLLTALSEQQQTIKSMAAMMEEQQEQNALIMKELTDTRHDIQRLTEQLPVNQQLDAPEQPVEKDNRGLWARILNR